MLPAELTARNAPQRLPAITLPRRFGAKASAASCILAAFVVALSFRSGLPKDYAHTITQLNSTAEELEQIATSHRFVLVGGPHGGGASLLWKLLESHSSVSAFKTPRTKTDKLYEGVNYQSVLPDFGIQAGSAAKVAGGKQADIGIGLGRYALSKESHLTEDSQLNSNATRHKLLSEWGSHWDFTRSLLLEKTPAHMTASRLYQALIGPQVASFLFITRHPFAVALTHRHWPCCKPLSFAELHLHWIASHRTLALDMTYLRSAAVVRYEDLVLRTRPCMIDEIFPMLGLSPDLDIPRRITSRANQRHEDHLCHHLLDTVPKVLRHCALAAALQPAIDALGLGYVLQRGSELGFGCLKDVMANSSLQNVDTECNLQEATPWVQKALANQWIARLADKSGSAIGPFGSLQARLICSPRKSRTRQGVDSTEHGKVGKTLAKMNRKKDAKSHGKKKTTKKPKHKKKKKSLPLEHPKQEATNGEDLKKRAKRKINKKMVKALNKRKEKSASAEVDPVPKKVRKYDRSASGAASPKGSHSQGRDGGPQAMPQKGHRRRSKSQVQEAKGQAV